MMRKPSFRGAMLVYAGIFLVSLVSLTGAIRTTLWIFLAGLVAKTLIAWKKLE